MDNYLEVANMKTIQAIVNPRLLTKASRLFTGTLQGRIIEILQNSRRAGATKVEIANQDGIVTVKDDGRGIEDFAKLLDMGGSGWEDAFEASEDPAGVGLFCLAPREVTIRSQGKRVNISGEGWTGIPVEIEDDPETVQGTVLHFRDEPWSSSEVDRYAVFTGLEVTVDGKLCPREAFLSDQAAVHPVLGCRIEVREAENLNSWHRSCKRDWHYGDNAFVNFHGQVAEFQYQPVSEHHLFFLVEMTGEPTGIRLMLPARTCLVENEAFEQLKAAIELEAYRYLLKRSRHRLPYKQYVRARELGVQLPEAEPTFHVGTLSGDDPEPIEITMPEGFPLAKCYRFDPDFKAGQETDEANVQLLGALGKFTERFVPVSIHRDYLEYSWAKLPTIGKVQIKAGKVLQEQSIWGGHVVCVDSLTISVKTSDGRTISSPVCMAVRLPKGKQKNRWWDTEVLLTQEVCDLNSTDILYHLGGYSDEGDTWDTQINQFDEEMQRFWDKLHGPDESLRRKLMETMYGKDDWTKVTISAAGTVTIHFKDGSRRAIRPPKPAKLSRRV